MSAKVATGYVLTATTSAVVRYPRRKVVTAEVIGWWSQLGVRTSFYVTAACGHMVIRRGKKAPTWVRCEGCEPT